MLQGPQANYVVGNLPLELEFSTPDKQKLDLDLVESSFDLLANPLIKMVPRKSGMIPTPFVLNDAIIIKQKINPSPKIAEDQSALRRVPTQRDSVTVAIDSIKR